MFKPGDKVKATNNRLGFLWKNHPEIMKVLHVSRDHENLISIVGNPKNGDSGHDHTKNWVYDADMFEACERVSSIPPENIEHDGYTYTRGEKVQESWVKEGVWAINDDGELAKIFLANDEWVTWETHNITRNASSIDYFLDQYRPFKEDDWKWGMYCEFQGEVWLLFINLTRQGGTLFANLSNEDSVVCVRASEITPTFKR